MAVGLLRLPVRLLVLVAALLACGQAAAQCPYPANVRCDRLAGDKMILGDLNDDGLVITDWTTGDPADALDDLFIFEQCVIGLPLCPLATYPNISGDFNFDGVIDNIDREYLQQLGRLADPVTNVGRIPKINLSEFRSGKPQSQTAPGVSSSRYVEFVNWKFDSASTPHDAADPADINRYGEGWYYVKVCRSTIGGSNPQLGTIAVVVDLEGMPFVNIRATSASVFFEARGRALLCDSSFISWEPPADPQAVSTLVSEIPRCVWDPSTGVNFVNVLPVPGSLKVPPTAGGRTFVDSEEFTNVTHLLVYRDPSPAVPGDARPVPAVGQFVIPQTSVDNPQCLPLPYADPPGAATVPWNVIVDAVTLLRNDEDNPRYGCDFADTPNNSNSIGPIGSDLFLRAPLHPFRCFNANRLIKGAEAITPNSDTPFRRNLTCQNPIIADCGELNPDQTPRNCFAVQTGPYCTDPDCCLNVCAVDATCCNEAWDQSCVDQALVLCTTCGQSTADCYIPHPTPSCEDETCCKLVCGISDECCLIAWDEDCAALARETCQLCGSPTTKACNVPSDLPFCNDAECCTAVCALDPLCCQVAWDAQCVEIAAYACGGCGSIFSGPCCIVHPTPYCSNRECCAAVCAINLSCCETGWDFACTQLASVLPACADEACTCGEPSVPGAPFDCFEAHPLPGCEDVFCCQSVCLRDSFCCYVEWDAACVRVSENFCAINPGCFDDATSLPVIGSCFVPHPTPGCDTPGCCGQVCAIAGFEACCDTAWDADCAAKAAEVCDECGDPFAGSCFQAHPSPNCILEDCCEAVCSIDSFCCETVWDALCASTARVTCQDPSATCGPGSINRSCWVPSYTPGCSNADCCAAICAIDTFCCEARWDAVCAREAGFLCERDFTWVTGVEGCLSVHDSPGCSNEDCSRAVCSVRPDCCLDEWDVDCVLAAVAVCPSPTSCPAPGACEQAHSGAGCRDSKCCNGVCAVDPTCCDTLWDSGCADIAVFLCEPPADSNWPCPCLGSCFESHDNPGCDNASCCSIVCNISPVCCDDGWDQSCAAFARDACCGPPGCGSGCNLPCLEEHEQPFCDDPYCCEAVCQLDPLCCLSTWDTACVGIALDRCGSACGLSPAGDCFVPHDLPGCDQGRCCAEVCSKDPACCNSGWDDLCVTEAAKTPKCVPTACGDFGAGSPCSPHPNPASELLDCCKEVCTADQYCCQVEWDTTCVDIARDIADCGCGSQCGDACAGSCCEGRDSPSCDDADCCLAVCSNDAYCCAVAWDATCAARARLECNAPGQACPAATCTSGNEKLPDCCVPSNQPFCSGNSACCKAVCAVDPFCCDTAWDVTCAERAGSLAGICKCSSSGGCGDPDAGSCFREHPTPYCADGGCCVAVCQFEPFCCSEEWDSLCVKIAQEICAGGFTDPLRPAGRDGTGKPTAERRRVVPEGWVPARERIQPKRPIPAPPGMPAPRRPVPMTPVDGAGPEGAAPAVAPPATPSKAAKGPAAAKP